MSQVKPFLHLKRGEGSSLHDVIFREGVEGFMTKHDKGGGGKKKGKTNGGRVGSAYQQRGKL